MTGERRDLAREYNANMIRSVITGSIISGINTVGQSTSSTFVGAVLVVLLANVVAWTFGVDSSLFGPLALSAFLREKDESESDYKVINCLIYARVSDDKQVKDGNGLENQVGTCEKLVEERGYNLLHEPILDKGISGTEFDRPGLHKLLQLSEDLPVDCIVVDKVDRLGRRAPQTLSMVDTLQHDFGVTIVTPTSRIDIMTIEGLVSASFSIIMADVENRNRGERVQKGKVTAFRNRNWDSWFRKVPFGYKKKGDWTDPNATERWIEVDESTRGVVEAIFTHFNDIKDMTAPYAEVSRHTEREYGVEMRGSDIKGILQNPVYVGKPVAQVTMMDGRSITEIVEDESLRLIDEETQEQALAMIGQIGDKHSRKSSSNIISLESLLEEFHPLALVEEVDGFGLSCSQCRGELVKNGTKRLDESSMSTDTRRVTNLKCVECGKQRKLVSRWTLFRLERSR
ncbi:recombinase family protein [Salinigranum salinum]|uniref:recombinase family protein n=1 Tax=Salinigranum salinum TaxID=1364937 RepID=UPI0012608145|nr:recombinase family protein [Salinigranum salinum]